MKRKNPFLSFLKLAAILVIICAVICTAILIRARPMIYDVAVSNAETLALRLTDTAVSRVLDGEKIEYDSIITLNHSEDGAVNSLEVNPLMINRLKTEISSEVSRLVSESPECPVVFPIGSLIGGEYTAGLGPMLNFKMQITATAYVNFKSNFISSGINQVLHQILLEIKVNGSVLSVGSRYPFSTSTSAIAAQSVIVGAVPDAFTNVIENPDSDIAGYIFDYGHLE